MEQRSGSTWRMTVNEKKFIEDALAADLRIDGRRPFDYRRITIKFGRHVLLSFHIQSLLGSNQEDGSSEVQLGETHVMGYVTAQLVQPYRDRPNEGTLAIFTEFSPMADPSLRQGVLENMQLNWGVESRAVDMESLCVVAGKSVWAIRVDLHILDNGGNLIDAANIAALAALLTFRRPECTVGGDNGQEVVVHDPEVREPLPLTMHHLPVAVTFAYFGEGGIMVIDPSYKEEAVMGGRMTATINSNGDVCAIQKAGGEGVVSSVIMQCLRIASVKAADITSKIKNAVDAYNTERALQKVKRQSSSVAQNINIPDVTMKESNDDNASASNQTEMLVDEPERISKSEVYRSAQTITASIGDSTKRDKDTTMIGGPSNWDPYSKGISLSLIRSPKPLAGPVAVAKEQNEERMTQNPGEPNPEETTLPSSGPVESADVSQRPSSPKSLKDAVKPKNRRKNKGAKNTS
uniref:Protein ECERIFERUM 7 n=1 Tax=Ananas comosus var. bracteatus TaxID=296719 RepID=A0A6V7QXP0_ANACO